MSPTTAGSVARQKLARASLMLVLAMAVGACGVLGGSKTKTTPTLGNRTPVLSRVETSAKVDPNLASVAVILPTAEINPEWAQAGGNAGKSYGHLALAATPQRAWTASIAGSSPGQRLAAAPVVGGGQLFVFDTDGAVHAFDATTGRPNWRTSLKGRTIPARCSAAGSAMPTGGSMPPPGWARSPRSMPPTVARCGGSNPLGRCAVRRRSPSMRSM